jgi:hypothetical protein
MSPLTHKSFYSWTSRAEEALVVVPNTSIAHNPADGLSAPTTVNSSFFMSP